MLKVFAQLEEEHHRHCLGIFADSERADCGNGHQEIFVKYGAACNVLCRCEQNFPAQHQIGNNKNTQRNEMIVFPAQQIEQEARCKERAAHNEALPA